jgi:cytochrome c biogenesis protein CcdA
MTPRATRGPLWLLPLALVVALAGLLISGGSLADALSLQGLSPVALVLLVTAAGLLDGLNPCAFSTLLLYVGTVFGLVERAAVGADPLAVRRTLLRFILPYIAMLFLVYFAFGAGLTLLGHAVPPGIATLVIKLMGAVLAIWGLLILAEAFFPSRHLTPSMPQAMARLLHRFGKTATVSAGVVSGGLFGLCAIPCSGAVYLAVLAIVARLDRPAGIGLLFLYNVFYLTPIVIVAAVATRRSVLQAVSRLFIRVRQPLHWIAGILVLGIGLVIAAR